MKRRAGGGGMQVDEPVIKSKNTLNVPDVAVDEDDMEEADPDLEQKSTSLGQNSRRAFLKELRKVVEGGDVILHVLDARDPLGTRSLAIEEMVLSHYRKKLVYVLNKADLVPRDVLATWLTYLRKSHPAIPFKCNTQNQKGHLGSAIGKVAKQQESALQTNQAVGAEELLGLLKNYARVGDTKSIISVGIVGFPNVGKSSLINSLNRSRAVGVSAMPGFTKVTQEVILDKNIRLIDSPGIVFADGDSAATSLRNCVNVEELEDVLTPVQAILERCPQPYLMQLYGIPKFKQLDCMAFLALVAKATGKLKKGGIPNTDAAARAVLHDWNFGRIKYYCRPPVEVTEAGSGMTESTLVSSFAPDFDISALDEADVRVLSLLEAAQDGSGDYVGMDAVSEAGLEHVGESVTTWTAAATTVAQKSGGGMGGAAATDAVKKLSKASLRASAGGGRGGESSVDMDTDDAKSTASGFGFRSTAGSSSLDLIAATTRTGVLSRKSQPVAPEVVMGGQDVRKAQKKDRKKDMKQKRREGSVDGDDVAAAESYSFEQDFQY